MGFYQGCGAARRTRREMGLPGWDSRGEGATDWPLQ